MIHSVILRLTATKDEVISLIEDDEYISDITDLLITLKTQQED